MDKYLLTVTVRADGSSKFAKGNQWGVFPSAALAWRISDEQFMQNTRNWLSSLKLRLSYGTAGNNRINSGLTYTAYSLSSNTARAPFFNGDRTSMMELGSYLYNPKLNGKQPSQETLVSTTDSGIIVYPVLLTFIGIQPTTCS